MRHTMGKDAKTDVLVYAETDKSNYIGVGKSKNNKYIFLVSQATLSAEYRMIDAAKPAGKFKVFQPRKKDVLYSVTPLEDRFLILTNMEFGHGGASGRFDYLKDVVLNFAFLFTMEGITK